MSQPSRRSKLATVLGVAFTLTALAQLTPASEGYWKFVELDKRAAEDDMQHWWELTTGPLDAGGVTVNYFAVSDRKREGGKYHGTFLWSSPNMFHRMYPGEALTVRARSYIHGRVKVTAGVVFGGSLKFCVPSGRGTTVVSVENKYPDKMSDGKVVTTEVPTHKDYGETLEIRCGGGHGYVAYIYKWQEGERGHPDDKKLVPMGDGESPDSAGVGEPSGEPAAGGGTAHNGRTPSAGSTGAATDGPPLIPEATTEPDPGPKPTAQWDFDDASNLAAAKIGSHPLSAKGSEIRAIPDGAVAIGKGSYYVVDAGMRPDHSVGVNAYTMLWDVSFPADSAGKWKCLLQTNIKNAAGNDGELFISKSGLVGCKDGLGGYSKRALEPDKWYRIVLRVENAKARCIYVNGEKWFDGDAGAIADRYSLDRTFNLAADDNGDDATIHLSRFAIYSTALSDSNIKALGGFR